MVSINNMIKQLSGMLGTKDLTAWEEEFLDSVYERTQGGKVCATLSDRQVAVIERLYNSHFAN